MARSAADVLGLLEAMVTDARGLSAAFEGSAVTVGVVRAGYYDADLGDDVRRAMAESEACFKDSGARIVEVDPGDVETAAADFFQLLCREALEVHAVDLERRPELFSGPVRDRLLSTRVITGRRVAELRASGESWRKHVGGRIFGVCDVLLTPLQLEPPLAFSDPALNAGVGRAMRFTFPWSLAGLPALSLPCGAFKNGLPIGCQLVGPPLADRRLIELGMRFQSVTGWHRRRPPLPDF
jgi:Asp-tRNA(Asn)/Glu-tRNA(Gln) amidotransferase A subunit family amidase